MAKMKMCNQVKLNLKKCINESIWFPTFFMLTSNFSEHKLRSVQMKEYKYIQTTLTVYNFFVIFKTISLEFP